MTTCQALAKALADGDTRTAASITLARLPNFQTRLLPESTPDKLVFSAAYRHADKTLSYHTIKVLPSLALGLSIRVTGRDEHTQERESMRLRFEQCLQRPF